MIKEDLKLPVSTVTIEDAYVKPSYLQEEPSKVPLLEKKKNSMCWSYNLLKTNRTTFCGLMKARLFFLDLGAADSFSDDPSHSIQTTVHSPAGPGLLVCLLSFPSFFSTALFFLVCRWLVGGRSGATASGLCGLGTFPHRGGGCGGWRGGVGASSRFLSSGLLARPPVVGAQPFERVVVTWALPLQP